MFRWLKNLRGSIERNVEAWRLSREILPLLSEKGGSGRLGPSARRPKGGALGGIGERVLAAGLSGGSTFGYPGAWSSDRIEQALHLRHFTFVAVRAICNAIAGLEPKIALVRSAPPRPQIPSSFRRDFSPFADEDGFYRKKSFRAVKDNEIVVPLDDGHPLCRLFRRPNAWDVAADLWYELFMFLELTGNAYLWVVPNGAGYPAELWVIPSHWVWPRLTSRGVDHYEVRPLVGPGTLKFPPEEVIHVRYKSPLHKIDGYSPQMAGSEWIDAAESVDRSRFWQFKNGCFPIGHLELSEQYGDPDDPTLERIYAKFFARLQGEANYGRPLITPPGAKYNPLTIAPVEMGYVESATQLRDWVLTLFGVPKEVAGIQDAGSEIAMYGPLAQFYGQCIAPKLRYLGQILTAFLGSRYHEDVRIWWEDPTPNSPAQINSDLSQDAQFGMITPAEYRAARGRQPYTEEEEKKYSKIGGGDGGEEKPGKEGGAAAAMPGAPPVGKKALPSFPDVTKGNSSDWREDDHKRADDGKFGSGSGSSKGKKGDKEGDGEGGDGEKKKKPTSKPVSEGEKRKLQDESKKDREKRREESKNKVSYADSPAVSDPRLAAKIAKRKRSARILSRMANNLDWATKNPVSALVSTEHAVMNLFNHHVPGFLESCPAALRMPLKGLWLATKLGAKALFASFVVGQKTAAKVIEGKPYSESTKNWVKGIATTLDFGGAKGSPAILKLAGLGGVAAIASSFIPLGSSAYLMYAAATTNPVKMLKSAWSAVKEFASETAKDTADIWSGTVPEAPKHEGHGHKKKSLFGDDDNNNVKGGSGNNELESALVRFGDFITSQEKKRKGGGEQAASYAFALVCAALDRFEDLNKAIDAAEKIVASPPVAAQKPGKEKALPPPFLLTRAAKKRNPDDIERASDGRFGKTAGQHDGEKGEAAASAGDGAAKAKKKRKTKAEKEAERAAEIVAEDNECIAKWAKRTGRDPSSLLTDPPKTEADIRQIGRVVDALSYSGMEALASALLGDPKAAMLGRAGLVKAIRDKFDVKPVSEVAEAGELSSHPTVMEFSACLQIRSSESPGVKEILKQLSRVPASLAKDMVAKGLGEIYIGEGPVTGLDSHEGLKNVRPRGWPKGSTWESIEGLYDPGRRAVTTGTGSGGSHSGSVFLHELGHAAQNLYKLDRSPEWQELHKKHYDKLNPYLQQDGPGGFAGCQEFFAEVFADVIMDKAKAAEYWGGDVVLWMINKLNLLGDVKRGRA